MKTNFSLLIIAIVALLSFSSCNKISDWWDTVTSGTEQPNDDDIDVPEHWVWSQSGVTMKLDLYPLENKFYTTVEEESPNHLNIFFQNDTWIYYKMVGDIMYVRRENESFPTESAQYNKWLILQHNEQYFEMDYAGVLPAIPTSITHYLFSRQN
jgi:hypothetical protein